MEPITAEQITHITVTDDPNAYWTQGDNEGIDQDTSVTNLHSLLRTHLRDAFPNAEIEIETNGQDDVFWVADNDESWSKRGSGGSNDPSPVSDVLYGFFDRIWRRGAEWLAYTEDEA